MSQPKVFITRKIPQAGLDALLPHVQMGVWPDRQPPSYSVLLEKDFSIVLMLVFHKTNLTNV